MNKNKNARPAATGRAQKEIGSRRSGFKKIIACLAGFVIIAFVALDGPAYFLYGETEMVQQCYVIRAGDTLWDVAGKVKKGGDRREMREIVYQIREQNRLDDYLHPGDKVYIWAEVLKDRKDDK